MKNVHRPRLRAAAAALAAVSAALIPALHGAADDNPGHYRDGEYDAIRNILPPGQTGFLSPQDVAQQKLTGSYPAGSHIDDQLQMYSELVGKAPGITAADLQKDYKDASFGVQPGDIASTESPSPGVTIIRDKSFGVPHVYGVTDADVAFGTGYILAEDRLFFADVLRHYGRSTLASFLGPSRATIEMDCAQAQLTGYSDAELDAQVDHLQAPYPALAQRYIDGINAYINAITTDPSKLPAEYYAFGLQPQPWVKGDVIAIAGLVGGIFGKGGGVETRNAALLRALYAQYGGPTNSSNTDPTRANAVFSDLMENEDPAAPTTVDASFPYEKNPTVDPAAVALTKSAPRDPIGTTCSVSPQYPLVDTPATTAAARIGEALLAFPKQMSNALLVDANHSTTGRPIAVFGPQVGYFAPQVLMEEDLHGPSFDARGASFPGTNFIVELGHGPDYAWSATSAGTDNIDQFVERLCNPQSADPLQNVDPASTYYMHDGACTAMQERTVTETALPTASTLAGGNPSDNMPRQITFTIERTVHGPVLDRTTALVGGVDVPVAISTERSTFMHEADSIYGFGAFNDPALMQNAQQFEQAAAQIQYTFNWFYIDNRDIAYYQSGLLPIRAAGVSPDLPTWGTGQWDWTGQWLGFDQHVHAIDPPKGWMTSWNNKGGRDFRASDDQWSYGPVFRSLSLDNEVEKRLAAGHGRMSLVDLDNAMESAASVDLRGTQLLPDALAIIGSDPRVAPQVLQTLSSWLASGAQRVDRNGDGIYDDAQAVMLMDEWFPRMVHAVFQPDLGSAFGAVPEQFDDHPGPIGSAFIEGWYGYLQKAMDMALGKHVAQPYSQSYCGLGSLDACRTALVTSLNAAATAAANDDPKTVTQRDDIVFTAGGLENSFTIPWQNRPTFQQVVDIPGHRPRTDGGTTGQVNGVSVTSLPLTGAGGASLAAGAAGLLPLGVMAARRRRRGSTPAR